MREEHNGRAMTLREQASERPLGVDVSDYGDEWCLGFMAGQVNALDLVNSRLREVMDAALISHGVGEMTEMLARLINEIDGSNA